jgi:chromosome segregation ATPase
VERFLDILWQRRWQILLLGWLLGALYLRVENASLRAALGDAQAQLRLADSLRSASATSAEAEAENEAARTKRCMLEATHLRAELGDVQAALVDARAHRMTLQAALDDAQALIDELRKAADAAAEEKARDEATRGFDGARSARSAIARNGAPGCGTSHTDTDGKRRVSARRWKDARSSADFPIGAK